jgi:hypothetical protein
VFIDSENHDWSGTSDSYICTVTADVGGATVFSTAPEGWTGWDNMIYEFDAGTVEWTNTGGACDEAAFMLGVSDPADWVKAYVWGFGFGPMNSPDFESSVSDAVGTDYASEWGGNVGIGWLYTNITGDTDLHDINILFNAPLGADGAVDFSGGDTWLDIGLSGVGDAAVAPDAYLFASLFFGFGWSR